MSELKTCSINKADSIIKILNNEIIHKKIYQFYLISFTINALKIYKPKIQQRKNEKNY